MVETGVGSRGRQKEAKPSSEVASRVKFGNASIGGQIQVLDVRSFTISHTKKVLFEMFSP